MPGIGIKLNSAFNEAKAWNRYWGARSISSFVATAISDTEIDLTWVNVGTTDYTGHKIYISTDNITYNLAYTIASITTAKSATGLTADTQYYFRIRPYNATDEGAGSGTQEKTLV